MFKYINITERADMHALKLLNSKPNDGSFKLGFRLNVSKQSYIFEPLKELKTKDYVLQPKKLVIFVAPDSYSLEHTISIDFDLDQWIFKKEAVKKEAVKKEAVKKEAVKKEAVKKEAVKKEAVKKEAVSLIQP